MEPAITPTNITGAALIAQFSILVILLAGIKFDLAKFGWIGKASLDTSVLIVDKQTRYKSKRLDDLRNATWEPAKMASSGVGSSGHSETLIVKEVLGLNLRVVTGYSGREPEMAMLRGEVSGQFGSYDSLKPFVKAEGARILLQLGAKKHPELPDVPLSLDQKASPQGKKLLSIIASISELWRLTATTPNVPPGRLDILRKAYQKALTDPGFLEEAIHCRCSEKTNECYGGDLSGNTK